MTGQEVAQNEIVRMIRNQYCTLTDFENAIKSIRKGSQCSIKKEEPK